MVKIPKWGVGVAVALVCLSVLVFHELSVMFFRHAKAEAPVTVFSVEDGEGFAGIARRLDEAKLISSPFWFRVTAEVTGMSIRIQTGEHDLSKGMSYLTILRTLSQGTRDEVTITIPEGYTIAQIGELAEKNFPITAQEWATETGVHASLHTHPFVESAQKPDSVDLEGYLFPDTYRFFPAENAQGIVRKLLDTMQSRVESLGTPTGDAAGMSTHDILTLASIIQREVQHTDDMKDVADIFLKRLAIGMALQADSTVNYVTGGNDPSISLRDRDIDSPYNTYKYPGLPPGPISNPGLAALEAVLHPATNTYYYFLTDSEGNVHYAKTYAEHLANKAKYLR